jgi:hypothetical protein
MRLALLILMASMGSVSCGNPRERERFFATDDVGVADDVMIPMGGCMRSADCDDGVACTQDLCSVGGTCQHVASGTGCVTVPRCTRAADCDDRVVCTRDTCLVDGTCSHRAQDDLCAAGQTCNATSGCSGSVMPPTGCRTAADCRDTTDCTMDACGADGRCTHTPSDGLCLTGQTCQVGTGCVASSMCINDGMCDDRRRCNGTERCLSGRCMSGETVRCDDSNPCTDDTCVETGAMACTHTPTAACMMSGPPPRSGTYTVSPVASYRCVDEATQVDVVNLMLNSVVVSATTTSLTIRNGTLTLSGPAVSGGMFSVRATVGTDCVGMFTLSGRFTDDTHFTGTLAMRFSGSTWCVFTTCEDQTRTVNATFSM